MTTKPSGHTGPICDLFGCDEPAQYRPDVPRWPDRRGAWLCDKHNTEAMAMAERGTLAYRTWIMQRVMG